LVESTLQSKRYAKAVFEIAQEHQDFDTWQRDLQQMTALALNSEIATVMENPKFSFENKTRLLNNQLKSINRLALNLTYILTQDGNFSLISAISQDYQDLLDNFRGIDKAEIITAIPLDDKEKNKLTEQLGAITGKKIILTVKVDSGIIGGIIARVGGRIIDGSTRNQLAALKNELANAGR
jgi:F-type H+-transporting ATPase subunit delta